MSKLTVEQLKVIINTGIDPDSEAATQIMEVLSYAVRARDLLRTIKDSHVLDWTDKASIARLQDWSSK